MQSHDYRDVLGGGFLIVTGSFVGLQSLTSYNLGTLRAMGPGLFPAVLGFILIALGGAVAIPGYFRRGRFESVKLMPAASVIASTSIFALTIDRLGLVPSVLLLTLISSAAGQKLSLKGAILLAVILSVLAAGVFHMALGLPVPLFAWPL